MQDNTDTYRFEQIELFDPISLGEMDKVKLMNRTDTKYWFHMDILQNLLEKIQDSYYILTMDNEVAIPYSTIYYDTPTNRMYTAHHNGKLNRYKIRRRSYVLSGISFLEVKFKSNKGRTIKKRIQTDFGKDVFNEKESAFIRNITPFTTDDLSPSLMNSFSRITLVNKNFTERCTVDFNLNFKNGPNHIMLNNLVVAEIKADISSSASPLARAMKNQRIKTSSFSKYCIGKAMTDSSVKRNAFKHKTRMIEKTIKKSSYITVN